MNGVRRIFGGGSSQPPPPPPKPVTPPSTASFTNTGKPSWPPLTSPPSSPLDAKSAPSTPGLVIRKDRTKPQPLVASPTSDETIPGHSAPSGSTPSSARSASGSVSSRPIPAPTRKPVPNGGAIIDIASPSEAGPSSPPVPPPSSIQPSESVGSVGAEWKRTSGLVNLRDELLMSLLTSEAVVDSRECEILSAEEVDELKKEHHVLRIRLAAVRKKLDLETKIRDAALSLSRVNAAHKKVSKRTEEHLEAAERKVDIAQKEFWRVSERASEVQRKLLDHRAGVLGYSVHKMEKAASNSHRDTFGRAMTPTRSSTLSSVANVTASDSRFDGAHFFAGHADAQIPRAAPTASDYATLEAKLRAATESLNAVNRKQAEMARELSHLRLEKEQIETTMSMELQTAEETVAALELELPRFDELQSRCDELLEARAQWELDKAKLADREREVERLEGRLEVLEEKSGETSEMEKMLAEIQRRAEAEVQKKEEEISSLQEEWEETRKEWEAERMMMEDDRLNELAALQDEIDQLKGGGQAQTELDEALRVLHTLMQLHEVNYPSNDRSLQGLLSSLGAHLEHISSSLKEHDNALGEWQSERERLESELRAHDESRQSSSAEVEALRRERDDAVREALALDSRFKELTAPSVYNGPPVEYKGEVADIITLLQPVWVVLPAPELRASKLNASRHLRASSTASSPGGPSSKSNLRSLSDLDIRALKALYDSKSPQSALGGNFSIEAFVARVQALVIDDRTLIERLIRFSQAHELLKKNAERAQKLAQDSNVALETYQKQVVTLDDQNFALQNKQAALMNEVLDLQTAVDRLIAEKRELEMHAADQAETCKQLTEVNNTLSAKTLTLAEEAASAPEKVRRQLEGQLAECKEALRKAQEEVDAMHASEQTQRIALLDELNSIQTDNANLRAQLRAVKK
ncbi:Up-regulated during septation-domain-containing protein [Phlebopus sp. FC_14]|nr:Up-regulated during septation-domain-containing protein [Phlebopus sp. FC_14]